MVARSQYKDLLHLCDTNTPFLLGEYLVHYFLLGVNNLGFDLVFQFNTKRKMSDLVRKISAVLTVSKR